ncbi:preprotein translocase subunit SecG [Thalassotalea piscium]|uniref:preprotein translocase subunit SecG n=1 Tax=Thalassotalea piscium TaxID=1230533 RepID=UPI00160AD44B|nr:preprotein translocase subunit SecG [Thalassotalea piscium]
MYQILIVVYLIVALCLIGLVLIQQGKGADMGASFGAGSSATIFGSSGSGNFLTKTTTWLAVAFFIISLVLGNLTANRVKATDEWDDLANPAVEQTVDGIPSLEPQVENTDVPAATLNAADKKKDNDIPD